MKVAFAADDSNECVEAVKEYLQAEHELLLPTDSDVWPEMSRTVAEVVASGDCQFAVLMCWTGTGTAIAANKVAGIRAASASDAWTAKGARLWNDANILTLSLKRLAPDVAVECVTAFLAVDEPDPEELDTIKTLADVR